MSKKFCVIGDPTNKPRFSSNIITSSLNQAAKELNLYDETGLQIKYDGVCNSHGDRVDAFICTYEVSFPNIILENAGGKPIIGVSLHNWNNIIDSGYTGQSDWFSLGVDTKYYPVTPKSQNMDKFVFALYSESLVRGGFETVLEAYCRQFTGKKDVKLIIKDRNATKKFIDYVSSLISYFDVDVEYINEHWDSKEQIIEFASKFDVYINTNRCSTFNMPVLEMMSLGKPSIITLYSGPADFCLDGFNCLACDYQIIDINVDLPYLNNIGCRNFFFPQGYNTIPAWARTDKTDLIDKMTYLLVNEDLRNKIAKNARLTAEKLTWKRSINHLSYIINGLNYY